MSSVKKITLIPPAERERLREEAKAALPPPRRMVIYNKPGTGLWGVKLEHGGRLPDDFKGYWTRMEAAQALCDSYNNRVY